MLDEARMLRYNRVTLDFLTPARIKYQGNYCFSELPLIALIQNLTLRVNALSYFHCGGVWDDKIKNLRDLALDVGVADALIRKREVLRYSNRQDN